MVVAIEERRVGSSSRELGMAQRVDEQVSVGDHAVDLRPAERVGEQVCSLGARRRPRDHLGEHRVVERTDNRSVVVAAVDAHAGGLRHSKPVQRAARRDETGDDILRVETGLDRTPDDCGVHGGVGQPGTLRNLDLQPDEIETGDHLRDRVLDLEPGVDLEQEERALGVHHELDRPRPDVAERRTRSSSSSAERLALGRRDHRRWRFLDDLLVTALDRTLALEQRDHGAVMITEDLHLDVPRRLEVLLEQDRAVAERRSGFALGLCNGADELVDVAHDPHPAATSAERGLDKHRIGDGVGAGTKLAISRCRADGEPGQNRHTGVAHQQLSPDL